MSFTLQSGAATAQQNTAPATKPDSSASVVSGIPASQLFLNGIALPAPASQFIASAAPGTNSNLTSTAKATVADGDASGKSVASNATNPATPGNGTNAADKSAHANSGNTQNSSSNSATNQSVPSVSGQQTQHGSSDSQAGSPATGGNAFQSVIAHPASPDPAASRAATNSAETHAGDLPRTASSVPMDNSEMVRASGINAARLIQTLNETGMHVGMRSAEFGDISIRTLVSQEQMVTQISVEHGDLGRAIAAHVPAVQTKLGDEFGLRASIQVNQSGASFSGEQQGSAQQDPRSYGRSVPVTGMAAVREIETVIPHVFTGSVQNDRLDIRA